MSDFRDALRAAGLHPRDVVADGRVRRCTTESKPHKRNGWYVLHQDGRGVWGDWTTGDGSALGHWSDGRAVNSAGSAASDAAQARRRERERAYRVQAMASARAYWREARPLNRIHHYVESKGLSPLGCAGLRANDGMLVVPVWFGDRITSVQTISPDGEKRFWPGAPVKAGCYLMDRPKAAVTAFCEGLATGLAVFQSVRMARVVVAFDAGNLLPVVQRLQPHGSVVFCADNDWATLAKRGFNPGIEKATNAASLIGAGVAYPKDIEGTDWADALHEWGPSGARRIEREILAGARYVTGAAA